MKNSMKFNKILKMRVLKTFKSILALKKTGLCFDPAEVK
jgi:hypothetical protein